MVYVGGVVERQVNETAGEGVPRALCKITTFPFEQKGRRIQAWLWKPGMDGWRERLDPSRA